jgi:hypothetical protein
MESEIQAKIAYLRQWFHSDFPITFRDAFDLSNRLGISYLWIDSLCIIQDDDEDWQRESSSMGLVY